MKKIFLLSVAASAMILGTACSASLKAPEKEVLDANIIVQLKGDMANKSEQQVIREQNDVISQIRSYVTPQIEVGDRFTTLVNAFSLKVNAAHVDDIRDLQRVKNVDYNIAHMKSTANDGIVIDRRNATVVDAPKDNISAATMNVVDGGNQGEGVLIAILDTGYLIHGETYDDQGNVVAKNVTHKTFTKLDKDVKLHDNIKSISDKINASKGFHGRPDDEHDVYLNSKVPFFYDYGGMTHERGEVGQEDFDVFTTVSEHGTHVASIAAGNDPFYKGIAPKAQLACMKVFTDYIPTDEDALAGATASTGAFDTAILKALEDCAVLGVDVINMSLGSMLNDFEKSSIVTQAFKILAERDVFCNVAAGNEGKGLYERSAYENWTTDMVETGALSTYSSSQYSMTVAAAQPDKQYYETAFLIGNKIIAFRDQVENYKSSEGDVVYEPERHLADLLVDHPDGKFEWVKIGGWGEAKDYDGVDVKGKIAIVDRGETTFADKINQATVAGAICLGVIDNDPSNTDFTFRMALSGMNPKIPVISILFKDKEFIDNSTDHTATLFSKVEETNPDARKVTTFTSDGPTYDLGIKPDIAAPGQSILGAIITGASDYDYFDGTSMATPNFCGAVALMISNNIDKQGYRSTINDRIMSTANIMLDRFGTNHESVRRQGAGLVDIDGALNSDVFLDGSATDALTGRAKIELRNNDDIKNGKVKLSFTAVSEASETINYTAKTYVYRPELTTLKAEDFPEFEDVKFQCIYDHLIGTATETVAVKPGANKINLAEYAIPADELTTINANFTNGCYIEGYVVLEAEGEETLNIPFLGFYGDYQVGVPVEPFPFERDNSLTYPSALINSTLKNWKNALDADYSSCWYLGYFNKMEDVNMTKYIENTANIGQMMDSNTNSLVPAGINPLTGESTGKDIYMGNNNASNTMIISQYVMRSVADNTITITNKATGKVVLIDHMFDSLFGAKEDDDENSYQWPLYKSHIDIDYWSAGYVAHRAYTIIPLYGMAEDGTRLANFPDGEYEMKFDYTLSCGATYNKTYTLHIDSEKPAVTSVEKIVKEEVEYYRVRYDEQSMAYYNLASSKFAPLKDETGYYYDFKISDYANGGAYLEATDNSLGSSKTLVKFDDNPLNVVVTSPEFNSTHTFDYSELSNPVHPNSETTMSYRFNFSKNTSGGKEGVTMTKPITVTMDVPAGFNAEKIKAYSLLNTSTKKYKEERAPLTVNGNRITFTISDERFRLDASADNDTSYALQSIVAYTPYKNIAKGETLKADSFFVTAKYECGIIENLTTGFTVDLSGVNINVAGKYKAVVTFNGKTTNVEIIVTNGVPAAEKIALEETPDVVVDQDGPREHETPTPEPQPEPQPPAKKKGCGGSILASSIIISMMSFAALGMFVIRGKKED